MQWRLQSRMVTLAPEKSGALLFWRQADPRLPNGSNSVLHDDGWSSSLAPVGWFPRTTRVAPAGRRGVRPLPSPHGSGREGRRESDQRRSQVAARPPLGGNLAGGRAVDRLRV